MGGAQGCDARGCCGDGRSKEVLILQTAPEWRDLNSLYLGEDVEHRSWFERWDEGGVADLDLDQGWLDRLELRAADPDGSEPGGSEPGGAEPGGADLGGADLGAARPQDSAFSPAGPSRRRSLRLIALPAVPVQNLVLDLDAEFPSAEAVAAGMGPTMLSGSAGAWPLSSRRRSDVGVLYSVEDDAAREAPQSLGDGQKVEALYASALRLGEEDEDGAISERDANDLAVFLCRHGEAERARRLQRHLLRLREARLGLGHPACAASASNLACSLLVCANRARPLGRDPWSPGLAVLPLGRTSGDGAELLEEAAAHARRAVEGLRSCLGRVHEDTLTCMNNLAAVLEAQGGHDEAEALYKEVLAWRKLGLGLHHVKTLTSATSLACLCEIRGRHKEAEKLCVLAHKGFLDTLGPDHPTTVSAVRNLASVLESQGRWRASGLLYQQVLEECDKRLGEEHLQSAQSAHDLASTLHAQGRLVEALPLYARALQVYDEKLGCVHPETLGVVYNSAKLLQAAGENQVAMELFQRELNGCEETLGQGHADTIGSVRNLALLLLKVGDAGRAERLFRRELAALEERQASDPRSEDDLLGCLSNLACALRELGRLEEAGELLRRERAGHELRGRCVGELGLRCLRRLEGVLRELGRAPEAEAVRRELDAAAELARPPAAPGLLGDCTPPATARWEESASAPSLLTDCSPGVKQRVEELEGLPMELLYDVLDPASGEELLDPAKVLGPSVGLGPL